MSVTLFQFGDQPSHRVVDVVISSLLVVMLSPIWLFNAALSLVLRNQILIQMVKTDAFNREVTIKEFRHGILRQSYLLVSVLVGKIKLCGVSMRHPLDEQYHRYFMPIKPGIFSLFDMYQWTGLIDRPHHDVLSEQVNQYSVVSYISRIVRIFIAYLFYSGRQLRTDKEFNLFDLKINNVTLQEALNLIFDLPTIGRCKLGFFVNVNSINLSLENDKFKQSLQRADFTFADGSGIRLAAAHAGQRLIANLNGTDLLPYLCQAAVGHNQSIYFLGSKPGIADLAAKNLKREIPGLKVAGTHHGYFKNSEIEKIIDAINESGADICLVAMGSPLQENWLVENAHKLNCSTALAVGGLLDFYSGKIPRAPRWMRELGFEWVWRLMQEPREKFNRYVVGNPLFLIRTYILNQARS